MDAGKSDNWQEEQVSLINKICCCSAEQQIIENRNNRKENPKVTQRNMGKIIEPYKHG